MTKTTIEALEALPGKWRRDEPNDANSTSVWDQGFAHGRSECADELEAALAALGGKGEAEHSSMIRAFFERGVAVYEFDFGDEGKERYVKLSDIRKYATQPEAQGEAVACDDIPPCPVWLAGKDASIAWAAGWEGATRNRTAAPKPVEGVTDAMVDRAAKALYIGACGPEGTPNPWEELSSEQKWLFKVDARAALTAAQQQEKTK